MISMFFIIDLFSKAFFFCFSTVKHLFNNQGSVIDKVSFSMLCHRRFGHIPLYKLSQLSLVNSKYHDPSIESCDICFKAKHHRLRFPTSVSSSTKKKLFGSY